MLVLSRKIGEAIVIGEGDDAVVVQVMEMKGDRVRLGIIAPRTTPVHRQEVYEKIHELEKK